MKYNKGFAPLVVLLIVLGVLAVGGVAYFKGKNNSKTVSNNPDYPPTTQEENSPVVQNNNSKEEPTTNLPAPVFTTNSATNISSNSATLNATILGLMDIYNSVGQSSYFEYGTSSTNLNLASSLSGATQGTLSTAISGLQSNTTYYFRAVINYGPNSVPANSRQYGNIMSFKTTNQISTTLPQYVGTHADCGGPSQCWPPIIRTSSQSYSCNNIGIAPNTEGNDVTAQRVINGKTYCIHGVSSGYAGGIGYTYTYTTSNENGTKIVTFGLTFPSCGNYDAPMSTQCTSNQTTFKNNLDTLIDSFI